MRKVVLERFGGPEVLAVRQVADPVPPPDGYVLEVRAAGINFADLVERRGRYRKDQKLPYELGKEAAGVVVARGPQAREFAIGDRAIAIKFAGGCYAERVALGPREILRGPESLDFEQLAACAIVFTTAWYGQNEIARLRPGEAVLIQAAAGAVGTAAIALARSSGASPVIGTAGGPEKCKWVESLGADRCVDYLRDDFRDTVRELTGGRGVDYVLESVGGEAFARSLESLAPMGRLVIIGFTSITADYAKTIERVHPLTLFHRSISVAGLNVENLDFPSRKDVWARIVAHIERHRLVPQIGPRFPLEQAGAAHAALEGRATRGKVLLVP